METSVMETSVMETSSHGNQISWKPDIMETSCHGNQCHGNQLSWKPAVMETSVMETSAMKTSCHGNQCHENMSRIFNVSSSFTVYIMLGQTVRVDTYIMVCKKASNVQIVCQTMLKKA